MIGALIKRDMRAGLVRGSAVFTTLFFFILTVSLFGMVLGVSPATLKTAAPVILWLSLVLACLLSLEAIYQRDYEDGTFDLLLLSPVSPLAVMVAKMAAHWLVCGLPLLLAAVIVMPMLLLPVTVLPILLVTILLGSLYLSVLGGVGAVLTFGAKHQGVLLVLLILPLYIPMLILGVMVLEAAVAMLPVIPYLLLQLALLLAFAPLLSWAAAVMLRLNGRS